MDIKVSRARRFKNKFKAKLTKSKTQVKNYIDSHANDDPFGLIATEKIFTTNHLVVSASLEDFLTSQKQQLKRKLFVWFHIILQLIVILRFSILALVNEPWIWTLFGDSTYVLKTGNLIFLGVLCFGVIGALSQYVPLFVEYKLDVKFAEYLLKIGFNEGPYKLEHRYYLEFCKKSRLMIRYASGPFFWIVFYVPMITFLILSIIAYLDTDMNFSIFTITIAYIMLFVWFRHSIAGIMSCFCAIYMASLYLKLNFKQIKARIQECIESGNSRVLIEAIHEHNYCSKLVNILNTKYHFSLALFVVYFWATPGFDILVHLTIYKPINTYMRIIYGLIFFHVFGAIFTFNYILTSVSSAAHDVTPDLYSFLVKNKCILRHNLKITSFIEKLCGPVIGYYCLDLFPFTTYQFYQYLVFVSCQYFLLNSLIFNASK
jgi:hypothetical protein